jgi:hypothetical protein
MNRKLLIITVWLLSSSTSVAGEDSAEGPTCGDFDKSGLTEGRPLIRVEPVVGAGLREDTVDSCIVVTYGLKEKRGTDGAALLAYKPKAVAQSDDVTKKEKRAAERALSKWLFLAKMHDASKAPVYYSVINY